MKEFYLILKEYLESTDKEYIFADLTYNRIKKYYKLVEEKHNIKTHFHMGRHFFVSLMIDSKLFSIKEMMYFSGHSDIRIFMHTYGHLLSNAVRGLVLC